MPILHSRLKYFTILLSALVWRAARIHCSDAYSSIGKWSSMNTPDNFTQAANLKSSSISFSSLVLATKVSNLSVFPSIWLLYTCTYVCVCGVCVMCSSLHHRLLQCTLQLRNNEHDDVLNHHRLDSLLNNLYRCRYKNQSSASLVFVSGRWPVIPPHKAPVTRKVFPFDDVIIYRHMHTYIMLTLLYSLRPSDAYMRQ